MKTITLSDLQELGRLLRGVRCRPMTEKEIAAFGTIPAGATRYNDYASFANACKGLPRGNYQAGANPDGGIYWTLGT